LLSVVRTKRLRGLIPKPWALITRAITVLFTTQVPTSTKMNALCRLEPVGDVAAVQLAAAHYGGFSDGAGLGGRHWNTAFAVRLPSGSPPQ